MKIAVASDHAGFDFKQELYKYLESKNISFEDFGDIQKDPNDDYPDYAVPAIKSILDGRNERAILICSDGIGMSIAANRYKGIRAALVFSKTSAMKSRSDNDSNVLCLGADEISKENLLSFVEIWLQTDFTGERHQRRLDKIEQSV